LVKICSKFLGENLSEKIAAKMESRKIDPRNEPNFY
jgi:hypothetical protein